MKTESTAITLKCHYKVFFEYLHSIIWGISCTMPQNLFSHHAEGGSQAPLGKGVSISIQSTRRRGDAEIGNKQKSCFFYRIWDEKTAFSQRLIWGSSNSDLGKCHFQLAAACPQSLVSQTQHLRELLTSLLQCQVKYVCLSEADKISTFLDSWKFLNHALPISSRNIIWKPMDLHISLGKWTYWYKAQTAHQKYIF